jgi:3-isopropylmalate dehydrogenase
MKKNIAVIRGDGIGPEIVEQALSVLDKVSELYGHEFSYTDVDMGGVAIDKYGDPLPQEMLDKCIVSDSVLLGAVGGEKWNGVPGHLRPEKGLLRLRAGMGVYSNNRPAKIWPQLSEASPLKPEIVAKGIDFIIVRELIGGIYFGEHKTEALESGEKKAVDVLVYSESEIERIGRIGFETAMKRNKKLCSVEKSNVLDSSRLWKSVMHRLAEEYPEVELSDMLVDNCAMQIVKNPAQFDVIVTENMFGDILSDEASMITGSIGMIPSSSLGSTSCGLYEPIHGSAPDIAGKDLANPIGTILSGAMMLRYSFDMTAEADAIENAVSKVLDQGYRTADIMPPETSEAFTSCIKVGCKEMGSLICQNLNKK